MPWIARGLRNGVVTSRWPRRTDSYFDDFHAAVGVAPSGALTDLDVIDAAPQLQTLCPTGAITVSGSLTAPSNGSRRASPASRIQLDRGRCILCGRCVEDRPDLFALSAGSGVARPQRDQLVVGDVPDTDHNLDLVRSELARRVRALRRSVHIRHVDAGSDGSDEWEIQALTNPVYDLHRLGIFFTASPRHADILLVTGIGAAGMRAPLARTRIAMPDPVVVIAAGADAISGGIFRESYSGSGGIGELLDVDIWVPGSPATPFSLLHAILLALGRLPSRHPRPAGMPGPATREVG